MFLTKFIRFSVLAVFTTLVSLSISACGDDPVVTPTEKTIAEIVVEGANFTLLENALKKAELVATFQAAGTFTVFAPTDEAFAKIPKATLDGLLKDKAALTKILTYHVVPGKVMAKDVKAGMVKTVQGSDITLATSGGVTVNGAKVVAADVAADNGVIHAIDTVIMPK